MHQCINGNINKKEYPPRLLILISMNSIIMLATNTTVDNASITNVVLFDNRTYEGCDHEH